MPETLKRKLNAPIFFTERYEGVDTDTKVLKGVVIVQEGEAKGHGVLLNRKFVRDVIEKGNSYGDVGVKSRFGHPNMCSDALGTYLGRYKNFRLKYESEEKPFRALADLHLDDSAKITPNGNLSEYIIKLATTDPASFGNSIVFKPGASEIKKEDDGHGGEIEIEYATIEELYESDLVDSPAATDSLFSQLEDGELAYLATNFLDDHPQVFDVIAKNPQIIEEFFEKYKVYKELKSTPMEKLDAAIEKVNTLFDKFKKLFEKEIPDEPEVPEVPETPETPEEEEFSEAAKLKIAAFEKEVKDMQAEITELKAKQVDETQLQEFKNFVAEAKALKEELATIKSTWTPPEREENDPKNKLSRIEELEKRRQAKKDK